MKIIYKSKAWLLLQRLHDFGPQTRKELTHDNQDDEAVYEIRRLMNARLMGRENASDYEVRITERGVEELEKANRAKAHEGLELTPKREFTNGNTRATYNGAELGRTCTRPGAYDAYALPSLIAGERHTRKTTP